MPEETGTPIVYDNPEEDTLQLQTDSELPDENLETQLRRSNRDSKNPIRYGSIPYTGNFWG